MNVRQPTLQDAFALHGQGRLGEAARLYEAIAAREPGNAEARHYLGAILASAGRIQEAKALMKRALELKPSEFAFLENYVGVLVLAEDFGEALELSRKALKRQPRNPNLVYLNAASLQKLDRLYEARDGFVASAPPRSRPSGGPQGIRGHADASGRTRGGAAGHRAADRRATALRRRLSRARQHPFVPRRVRPRPRRLRTRAGAAAQRPRTGS